MMEMMSCCNEFDQATIIQCFCEYSPVNNDEAERILQCVFDRAFVTNEGLYVEVINLVLNYQKYLNAILAQKYLTKLAAMLMKMNGSLISNKQYDVLFVFYRSVKHFIAVEKELFKGQMFGFYINYDDPLPVRKEKLEILMMLVDESNAKDLILELIDYSIASSDFAPLSLQAISTLTNKFVSSTIIANECVDALVQISTKTQQLSELCLISLCEILVITNGRYLKALPIVLNNIEELNNSQAKCALIYLCGNFVTRISNAKDLVKQYVESYKEETLEVRLALLTACGKIYSEIPFTQTTMKVLQMGMKSNEYDERERAVYIWRTLSRGEKLIKNPTIANEVIIQRNEYIHKLGRISTVLQIQEKDIQQHKQRTTEIPLMKTETETQKDLDTRNKDLYMQLREKRGQAQQANMKNEKVNELVNIGANPGDISAEGYVFKRNEQLVMNLRIKNISNQELNGIFMQLNKNSFGLMNKPIAITHLRPNEQNSCEVELVMNPTEVIGEINNKIQLGISHREKRITFYSIIIPLYLFGNAHGIEREPKKCAELYHQLEQKQDVQMYLKRKNVEQIKGCLEENGFMIVADKLDEMNGKIICGIRFNGGAIIMIDIDINVQSKQLTLHMKSNQAMIMQRMEQSLESLKEMTRRAMR